MSIETLLLVALKAIIVNIDAATSSSPDINANTKCSTVANTTFQYLSETNHTEVADTTIAIVLNHINVMNSITLVRLGDVERGHSFVVLRLNDCGYVFHAYLNKFSLREWINGMTQPEYNPNSIAPYTAGTSLCLYRAKDAYKKVCEYFTFFQTIKDCKYVPVLLFNEVDPRQMTFDMGGVVAPIKTVHVKCPEAGWTWMKNKPDKG